MLPNEYKKIFGGLYQATQRDLISWSPGAEESQYVTAFDAFSIAVRKVWRTVFDNEELVYDFSLHDMSGDEIDSFSMYDSDYGYSEAAAIFEAARRNALEIDTAIKEIERILGVDKADYNPPKLKPGPETPQPPPPSQGNDDDLPF